MLIVSWRYRNFLSLCFAALSTPLVLHSSSSGVDLSLHGVIAEKCGLNPHHSSYITGISLFQIVLQLNIQCNLACESTLSHHPYTSRTPAGTTSKNVSFPFLTFLVPFLKIRNAFCNTLHLCNVCCMFSSVSGSNPTSFNLSLFSSSFYKKKSVIELQMSIWAAPPPLGASWSSRIVMQTRTYKY